MSCMTCHDPHRDDQGSASFYEAKCLSCHGTRAGPEQKAAAAPRGGDRLVVKKPVVCPVNSSTKCLECHMPKVAIPLLHRDLTDHFIRVHDANTKR